MQDWEFSSYNDYTNKRNGNIINKELAMQTINFDDENFETWSFVGIDNDDYEKFLS